MSSLNLLAKSLDRVIWHERRPAYGERYGKVGDDKSKLLESSERLNDNNCAAIKASNRCDATSQRGDSGNDEIFHDRNVFYANRDSSKFENFLREGSNSDALRHCKVDGVDNNLTKNWAKVKLPHIKITIFDGDKNEWMNFRDLFKSSIHDNPALSKAEKLSYLKGLLRGPPSLLLRDFTISDVNYDSAWDKLNERFNRSRPIMMSLMERFLVLPSIKTDRSNLQEVTDEADNIVRSLRNLNSYAATVDPWLIHLLLKKVDSETKRLWAIHSQEVDSDPSFELFIRFLDRRCDSITVSDESRPKERLAPNSKRVQSNIIQHAHKTCLKCNESHQLYQCPSFQSLSLDGRREFVRASKACYNCLRPGHSVQKCISKSTCFKCSKRHHSMLHLENTSTGSSAVHNLNSALENGDKFCFEISILPSASVYLVDNKGGLNICRVVFDSGSQGSFVKDSFLKCFKVPRTKANIVVFGIHSVRATTCKTKVQLKIMSRYDHTKTISVEALVISKIMSDLPAISLPLEASRFNLADVDYDHDRPVDLILGANLSIDLWEDSKYTFANSSLKARSSTFGWIVYNEPSSLRVIQSNVSITIDEDDTIRTLNRFWSLEGLPDSEPGETIDIDCEDEFLQSHYRSVDGRYVVNLPFKSWPPDLGESYHIACNQFRCIERRFAKDDDYRSEYVRFMRNYLDSGHMTKISREQRSNDRNVCYIPHHGILQRRLGGTKFRTVFNASVKTSNGTCLNDHLYRGSNLQADSLGILLRIRQHRFVMTGDIEQMFRQILINPAQTDLQRIVWRETPDDEMGIYKLLTVTYGMTCAPYLANRVLKQLASDYRDQYPRASSVIDNDTYMDDMFFGSSSLSEVTRTRNELIELMNHGGFKLKKWAANSADLLSDISTDDCATPTIFFSGGGYTKLLGIRWDVSDDCFSFKIENNSSMSMTKRQFLSCAAQIYDPMGLISPVCVILKQLFQKLTSKNGVNWDDELSEDVLKKWSEIRDQLPMFQTLQVPRFIFSSSEGRFELHGFCDASMKSYAAALYVKAIESNGHLRTHLLIAKTKVAPLSVITIPRLELCGALLLSKLVNYVMRSLNCRFESVTLWCDSQIVLAWIAKEPKTWNPFVLNRVKKIHDNVDKSRWMYVRSSQNPADIASRGVTPKELIESELWWRGPDWLSTEGEAPAIEIFDTNEERRIVINATSLETDWILKCIESVSSFARLRRIFAYISRSGSVMRRELRQPTAQLTATEIKHSEVVIVKAYQLTRFREEAKLLKKGSTFPKSNQLKRLAVFIDNEDVIRLHSRIGNSELSFDERFPMILDSCHLARLIVRHHHVMNMHSGVELTLNLVRQRYWILKCRNIVKFVIRHCSVCVRYRSSHSCPPTGDLPPFRVIPDFPFSNSGVDYAGPISVRAFRRRGNLTSKGYIVVFVCLVTKAIHLEVAMTMSSESFLFAFKRFISRRGFCSLIVSDNGRNFVGARNELRELGLLLSTEELQSKINEFTSERAITWKFIPAYTPHFGGIWESSVKSVKNHLKRTFRQKLLTIEELNTVLCEVEAIVNSRPLIPLKEDSEQLDVISANHFLLGRPHTVICEDPCKSRKLSDRYRVLVELRKKFWDSWRLEYLNTLKSRTSMGVSDILKIGNIVIVKRPFEDPSVWCLGRVFRVYPGSDGVVRVAEVSSKKGLTRESIKNLIPLVVKEVSCSSPAREDNGQNCYRAID